MTLSNTLYFLPNSCKTIDILISLSCTVCLMQMQMLACYHDTLFTFVFYNPSYVIRSQVDSFKPDNSQLALNASLTSPLYMQIYTDHCFYTKKETSSCIMFADLTGRPKWLRICCKQCFTGFIMSLPTEQVSKLSVF